MTSPVKKTHKVHSKPEVFLDAYSKELPCLVNATFAAVSVNFLWVIWAKQVSEFTECSRIVHRQEKHMHAYGYIFN